MALFSIDASLLIAAGASFVTGLLGYIIIRLWIRPVARYTLTKRKLGRELSLYRVQINPADGNGKKNRLNRNHARLKAARKLAMALDACYSKEIPYWYRLLVDSRQESPAEALGQLTSLSKIKDGQQIQNRIEKVRQALRLKL
jgi:hypothetical protein